jgi:hypothetical protein
MSRKNRESWKSESSKSYGNDTVQLPYKRTWVHIYVVLVPFVALPLPSILKYDTK